MPGFHRKKTPKLIDVFLAIFLGVVIFIILLILVFVVLSVRSDRHINDEIETLKQEKSLLSLPESQRRSVKHEGCTWSDRQSWDIEVCEIGIQDVFDEKGPGSTLEQQITKSLLDNGWQKRNSLWVSESSAVEIYSSEASFTKQTSKGRLCAGYSHQYFSDDIVSGHRALYFYLLGPSDNGCHSF